MQKRQDQRIQLINSTDVLHVCVELITQTEIQSELRMHAPVILNKAREVSIVGVWQKQRAIRKATAKCDGKQQIVIINAAIVVAIEIRKVFNQLDAALLKDFEIEIRLDALNLAAEIKRMI